MSTNSFGIIRPTPEEDAEINAQITEDPDDFEADEEWFKEAKPSEEIVPHILERHLRENEEIKSWRKERLSILLDKEVLDYYRAGGGDWHSRINGDLRKVALG
jgi:uncharacterized protein (DUF4415 family)